MYHLCYLLNVMYVYDGCVYCMYVCVLYIIYNMYTLTKKMLYITIHLSHLLNP